MSTTQACAHVCTAKPMPFIGTDPAAPGSDRTTIFVHVTGATDVLSKESSHRRFWVVDTRAPSDVPPPNALQLTEVLLPELQQAPQLNWHWLGNGYGWWSTTGDAFYVERHLRDYELKNRPERAGKWIVGINRKDEAGRIWSRTAVCVPDDFGWLVEVPQC